jgi:hypothetical protein
MFAARIDANFTARAAANFEATITTKTAAPSFESAAVLHSP